MTAEARSFVVDGGAATVCRRQLGATAWAVLEQLLSHVDSHADGCEASVSVRSLAVELGVSKDTVARALSRLRDAELVTAKQARSASGAFSAGSYRIVVPACITLVAPDASTPATSRPVPHVSTTTATQQSLFDRDPSTS